MRTFARSVIIGAGTMGRGIAHVNAMAGIRATLTDVDAKALSIAKDAIQSNLDRGVQKGKVEPEAAQRALTFLSFETGLDAVADADLIIEAVLEKMELKKTLFAQIDARAPEHAVLATNTSSLSISQIAGATQRPESVVGLHFFNPPHLMKLLEIVRGERTSNETLERCKAYAAQIGKTFIEVIDSPGFATSRLGICLANEAVRMLESGVASAKDIDTAMVLGYGHPMGPLQLTDLVGLDVRLAISDYLHQTLKAESFEPPTLLKDKVAKGQLGKKAGAGFYLWEGDNCIGPADA